MSYYAATAMAGNTALQSRIASAAAMEGEREPYQWMNANIYSLVSRQEWVVKWDYAEDTKTRNVNPDTGDRDDVISDDMIKTAVQEIRGSTPTEPVVP